MANAEINLMDYTSLLPKPNCRFSAILALYQNIGSSRQSYDQSDRFVICTKRTLSVIRHYLYKEKRESLRIFNTKVLNKISTYMALNNIKNYKTAQVSRKYK